MWDQTGERFRNFDFLPRPGPDEAMAELSSEIAWSYLFCWPRQRVRRMLSGLLARNARRRAITRHIFQRSVQVMLPGALRRRVPTGGMFYPAWYDG